MQCTLGSLIFYGDFSGEHYKNALEKIQHTLSKIKYEKDSNNITENNNGYFFRYTKYLDMFWGKETWGYVQVNGDLIRLELGISKNFLDIGMILSILFLGIYSLRRDVKEYQKNKEDVTIRNK